MFYKTNLPVWERAVRLIAALLSGSCAWHYWPTPVGIAFAIFSVLVALTGFVGFCPMCALAGRKIAKAAKAKENSQ